MSAIKKLSSNIILLYTHNWWHFSIYCPHILLNWNVQSKLVSSRECARSGQHQLVWGLKPLWIFEFLIWGWLWDHELLEARQTICFVHTLLPLPCFLAQKRYSTALPNQIELSCIYPQFQMGSHMFYDVILHRCVFHSRFWLSNWNSWSKYFLSVG